MCPVAAGSKFKCARSDDSAGVFVESESDSSSVWWHRSDHRDWYRCTGSLYWCHSGVTYYYRDADCGSGERYVAHLSHCDPGDLGRYRHDHLDGHRLSGVVSLAHSIGHVERSSYCCVFRDLNNSGRDCLGWHWRSHGSGSAVRFGGASITGTTFTGTVGASYSGGNVFANDTSGTSHSDFYLQNAGVYEWGFRNQSTNNAFQLNRYVAGTYTDTPLTIYNSTGGAVFSSTVNTGGSLAVAGAITASASNAGIFANDTSGSNTSRFGFQNNGTVAWALVNGSGNSAFSLNRYTSGTLVDSPIAVSNSTGLVSMSDGVSTTSLTVANASAAEILNDTSGTGITSRYFQSAGANVWSLRSSTGAAGPFQINRYVSGTVVDTPLSISNSTGLVAFSDGIQSTTGSFSGTVTLNGSVAPQVIVNDTSGTGTPRYIFNNNGTNAWALVGNNSSSVWQLYRYVSGTLTDQPISVAGSTGIVTLSDGLVTSSISTNATGAANTINDTSGTGTTTYNYQSNGSNVWSTRSGTGPTGAFQINRYTSGSLTDTPVSISNSTGLVTLTDGLSTSTITTTGTATVNGLATGGALIGGGTINATTIGATTASTGAFTTLSASGTVSGTGFSTLLSPYALLAGATFTGPSKVSYSGANLALNDTSGTTGASVSFTTNGTNLWGTGSSSGNAWVVSRFVSGTYTDSPISIANATGAITLADAVVANSSVSLKSTSPVFTLNDTSGTGYNYFALQNNGTTTWQLVKDTSQNFGIQRYVSGTLTDTPISVANSSGVVAFVDGITVKGTAVLGNLTGTTGSIGGSSLAAGACTSGTVAVTNSTTAMAVVATPVTYPGDGIVWHGYVSAAGTVTVKVCAITALTPTASTYNVRVLQ